MEYENTAVIWAGAPSCFLNDETGRLTSSHHLQLRARYPKNGGINGVAIPYLSQ